MQEIFSKENQLIAVVIIGTLLLFLMGGALLTFFFFSRKKIVEKELENKTLEVNHQKEMISSIIVTQEKERERIAQDLHDDISSKLNIINLNANLLKDGILTPEEYVQVYNTILEVTDKTLHSARKIAHNLLPPILERFGLQEALEELADTFSNSKKINIEYIIEYPKKYLSSQDELHLFRITQELINNSVRHGKAKNSKITLLCKTNTLVFTYTDNGLGFNYNQLLYQKGLGMKNIESRVSLLNGNYTVESKKNNGFKLTITITKHP